MSSGQQHPILIIHHQMLQPLNWATGHSQAQVNFSRSDLISRGSFGNKSITNERWYLKVSLCNTQQTKTQTVSFITLISLSIIFSVHQPNSTDSHVESLINKADIINKYQNTNHSSRTCNNSEPQPQLVISFNPGQTQILTKFKWISWTLIAKISQHS